MILSFTIGGMTNRNESGQWEYRVPQNEACFCGPAVAVSLLRFSVGMEVSQEEVIEAAGLTLEEVGRKEKDVGGVSPDRLKRAMEKLAPSVVVLAKLEAGLDDLRTATDAGFPVIVVWQTTDEDNVAPPPDDEDWGHYSIVVEVEDKYVYISDPSGDQEKIREIKKSFFEERWWDRNEGVDYPQLMMVVVLDGKSLNIPGLNCDILKS